MNGPTRVYVGMVADLLHPGHIAVLAEAKRIAGPGGVVLVGLLTDKAVEAYKGRLPVYTWRERAVVLGALRAVTVVVPQHTLDYEPNLRKYRPDFVVHGDDWRTGTQAATRANVIAVLGEWNGTLIEPAYTEGISTTEAISRIISRNVHRGGPAAAQGD